MTATIIRIGNSNGVVLPAKIMKALSLSERDSLVIKECDGGIFLKKIDSTVPKTVFSALDEWNESNGYDAGFSMDDVENYIQSIRNERKDKEASEW